MFRALTKKIEMQCKTQHMSSPCESIRSTCERVVELSRHVSIDDAVIDEESARDSWDLTVSSVRRRLKESELFLFHMVVLEVSASFTCLSVHGCLLYFPPPRWYWLIVASLSLSAMGLRLSLCGWHRPDCAIRSGARCSQLLLLAARRL